MDRQTAMVLAFKRASLPRYAIRYTDGYNSVNRSERVAWVGAHNLAQRLLHCDRRIEFACVLTR